MTLKHVIYFTEAGTWNKVEKQHNKLKKNVGKISVFLTWHLLILNIGINTGSAFLCISVHFCASLVIRLI